MRSEEHDAQDTVVPPDHHNAGETVMQTKSAGSATEPSDGVTRNRLDRSETCPECGCFLIPESGCAYCPNCGHSRCG